MVKNFLKNNIIENESQIELRDFKSFIMTAQKNINDTQRGKLNSVQDLLK